MAQDFLNRNVAAVLKHIQAGMNAFVSGPLLNFYTNVPVQFLAGTGYILLPAMPFNYRLCDCKIITLGGNAAGGSVQINGTSTLNTPLTLVTFAPAGLLANTLTRMGDPNTTVNSQTLAAIAVNTPIRVVQSGGAITGATSFLVSLDYSVFNVNSSL